MAEENDMDVGEMMALAISMVFERCGKPNPVGIARGRRQRD
jgi:hypothetical protein